jgi:hypothetical protein
MAKLYYDTQLIATSEIHGVLGYHLVNEEIIITYNHKKNKYYTIIIYDENIIHALLINIKGDDLSTGDIIVEYVPFENKGFNYESTIYIYEQPNKLPLPEDDFDMETYSKNNKLKLLYVIDFMILQKIHRKPNIYSKRVYINKLKQIKNI